MKWTVLLFALCCFVWKCSSGVARQRCPKVRICPKATASDLQKGLCSTSMLIPGTNCRLCGISKCSKAKIAEQLEQLQLLKKINRKSRKEECEEKCRMQPGACHLEPQNTMKNCKMCSKYVECTPRRISGAVVA